MDMTTLNLLLAVFLLAFCLVGLFAGPIVLAVVWAV